MIGKVRLAVHRTNTHIYAQLAVADGKVLTSPPPWKGSAHHVPTGAQAAAVR